MGSRQNGEPLPESISSRAAGRPPEEADSEDPEAQARTILEESDDRVRQGQSSADGDQNTVKKLDNGELTGDVITSHEVGDDERIVGNAPIPETSERS